MEDLRRNRLGREVEAFLFCFIQHGGKDAHLEFEGKHIHAGRAALAAFRNDFLDEQPPDRQVDRTDNDQAPTLLAVEETSIRQRLGAVGFQDQLTELRLLLRQRLFFLLSSEPSGNIQIGLAFVAAQVQHLEGAEGLTGGFQLALDLNQPLARRVNPELAEVGSDPFAAQIFGHSRRRAATTEKVRHQIAFVTAEFENALKQLLRLLCRIAGPLE